MYRALHCGNVVDVARRAAILFLALGVFAFFVQPCFASPLPVQLRCCPLHPMKCHTSKPAGFCTMSSTPFAGPEESTLVVPLDSETQLPKTLSFVEIAGFGASHCTWVPDRARSFLLNSVLLI